MHNCRVACGANETVKRLTPLSFVLIQPEVRLPLRLKPRASPVRRFGLWPIGKKNPHLGDITLGRLLLKAQAPSKLLCSNKDFKHGL